MNGQCEGKVGYSTAQAAHRAMGHVKGRVRRKHAALAPYRCHVCQMWHLGRAYRRRAL